MTPLETKISRTLQRLGCTTVIVCCIVAVMGHCITRDTSFHRIFQSLQDLCTMCAHFLIHMFYDQVDYTISCRLTSVLLQYFYVAGFYFLMVESLYNYVIIGNMGSLRQFTTLKNVLMAGFVAPIPFCMYVGLVHWDNVDSTFSCWLNIGEEFSITTFAPLLTFMSICVIALESIGIEVRRLHDISFICMDMRLDATVSFVSMHFMLPLVIAAWYVDMIAIYHMRFPLFPTAFALNVSMAIGIAFTHAIQDEKLRDKLYDLRDWVMEKLGRSETSTQPDVTV